MLGFIYNLDKKNTKNYLLLALAFFLTVSVYITDLIILILVLLWSISGNFKEKLKIISSNSFIAGSIYFFIFFILSYIFSEGFIWNPIIKKQLLLLLLPVLYTLNFNEKYIEKAKYAYISGLALNIILSVVTIYFPENAFFKSGHYESSLFLHGFLDHFDYSIFLCFGIILIFSTLEYKKYSALILLMLIFLIALLNSFGRIGIISFFIFFPILIVASKKYYFLAILIIGGVVSYHIFKPLNDRVNQTIHSIKLLSNEMTLIEKVQNDAIYLSSKNDSLSSDYYKKEIMKNEEWIESINAKKPKYETSIGKRFLYAKNSLLLIKEKPFFGAGANQFEKAYLKYSSDLKKVKHPHNNFLFILVELGTFGLITLLYIFYSQLKLFWTSKKTQIIQLIFPLFFLWIMLFDNYFLNHNTLVFFCLFSFLIYYPKRDNIY